MWRFDLSDNKEGAPFNTNVKLLAFVIGRQFYNRCYNQSGSSYRLERGGGISINTSIFSVNLQDCMKAHCVVWIPKKVPLTACHFLSSVACFQ